MARTTTYFAANSGASLESVCQTLRTRYGLPAFAADWHDSWQYAFSKTSAIGFNVSKADDNSTIQTWMDDCPNGVNFQIIADYHAEPDDLDDVLNSALGVMPARYCTRVE